jgi:adenine-specific DNA-methyltransferase
MLITLQEFTSRLGETGGALWAVEDRIVVGDCLEALRHMPDCSVDLIHTSPPYNIDKAYKGDHGDKKGVERYLDFLRLITCEMKRVLKPNASLFWQTGYTQSENGVPGEIIPIDMLSYGFFRNEPHSLILWDRIIWRYFGGMAFKRKYTNRHETILWFVKPLNGVAEPRFDVDAIREKSRELDKRNNFWGRNPGNVWEVDRVAYGTTQQSSHIAVYPEEITEKIIRATSGPAQLVLDPFSGSGTTPKVARSLGRRWIGIEISPHYAEESVRRIGFQQPNEVASLASALMKEKVFGARPGSLPVDEIVRRFLAWAKCTDFSRSRALLSEAVARVFRSPNGRDAKPEIWDAFERLTSSGPEDPVVEADGLLAGDYKNRRNLNGVLRYRTALETLEGLVSRLQEASEADLWAFIEELAANEPSSYQLSNHVVTLTCLEKRLKPPARGGDLSVAWLQGALELGPDAAPAAALVDDTAAEEAYQPPLLQ